MVSSESVITNVEQESEILVGFHNHASYLSCSHTNPDYCKDPVCINKAYHVLQI